MSTGSPFDFTASQRAELGRAALDWVLDWFDRSPNRVLFPHVTAAETNEMAADDPPDTPQDPRAVLDDFIAQVVAGARDNGHPRMFGYVQSSQAYVGVLGDFLASALNQNVTSWRSAPSATTIERQTIRWLKTMVGFDPRGEGLLLSGGSMGNLVGLAAALTTADPRVSREGVRSLRGDPVIYASTAVHMSIPKAAGILGLGQRAVRRLPADDDFRLDLDALDRELTADRRAGRIPICVVANAGEVNTGAVDAIDQVADVCRRHNVWLHADGAYGALAVLAPSGRAALAGLGRVDSLSLDPHKWLYVPLDAGCALVRDPTALVRAFSYSADYVDVIATPQMSEYAFWNYGPELSRRFRALKVWMVLKIHGVRAIAEAIERNIVLARQLAALVDEAPDFQRLAPAPLSIVCFRYVPPALRTALVSNEDAERRKALEAVNALNRAAMVDVQLGGRAYLSNAMIGDAFALRACIVNHRTRDGDLAVVLDEIRAAASRSAT